MEGVKTKLLMLGFYPYINLLSPEFSIIIFVSAAFMLEIISSMTALL